MNQHEEKSLALQTAESPWVKGPILGASVMALVTPLLKWTNHVYDGKTMPRKNFFTGASAYALSAIPGYATTFAFKAMLQETPENTSKSYELLTSLGAGSLSGFVCTPFEAIAQNKQIGHYATYRETAQLMFRCHGYTSLFRGGASIMLREGLWSAVYLSAIPQMSEALQEQGLKKQYAEPLAMLSVAGMYGFISSPINQLRYRKQDNLTKGIDNKSYFSHAKSIIHQEPNASPLNKMGFFFKASLPRAMTTTVAAGLMVKGSEYYDKAIAYHKP